MGFLNQYGLSSFENDVNTYAENYFVHHKQLLTWADAYPVIAAKLKLFEAFLKDIGMMSNSNNANPKQDTRF